MKHPGDAMIAAAWLSAVDGRVVESAARLFGVQKHQVNDALYRANSALAFVKHWPHIFDRARIALREDEALSAAQLGKKIGIPGRPAAVYMRAVQFEDMRQKFRRASVEQDE